MPEEPGFLEGLALQSLAFAKEELAACQEERNRIQKEDAESRFTSGGFDRDRPTPSLPDCSGIEANIAYLEEALARLHDGEGGNPAHPEPSAPTSTGESETEPRPTDPFSNLYDLGRRLDARDENVKRLIREMRPSPGLLPRSPKGIPKYAVDLYRFFVPFAEAADRADEYRNPEPVDEPQPSP
jgi:hypothetical protein